MAGVDASIPLSGKRPDTIGKISDLLNMQRSKTALASEQQTQSQREALASFDVSKILGEDGTIDLNKIPTSGLREAAGDTFPQVLSQYAQIKQQQLAAKQTLVTLNDAQRQSFGEMMGALRSDPDVAQDTPEGRQKVSQAFAQYAQMYGPDVENVLRSYAAPIQGAPPGKLGQVIQNIQLQAVSAADQASKQQPAFGYVDTGPTLERTQANPLAPGGAEMPGGFQRGFTPGERFPITTNATGQIVRPDRVTGSVDVMGGTNPTAAQAQIGAGNVDRVQQAVTEAASVPQVRNVLQNIIKLSDEVTTGPKSEQLNRIKSIVGNVIPGAKGWQDSSSAYQEMTKYMEQLALRSWASAGGSGTNTQLEAQIRSNPNNEYNSQTVKDLAKWVLAGEEAKLSKTRAMMNWLQQPGNTVNNAEQFEVQWAEAMDPRVFQVDGMDTDELKKKFSVAERKEIMKNYERLQEMGAIE